MRGVLHPVGPETARTYWLRRALLSAALVVVIVVVALIARFAGSNDSSTPVVIVSIRGAASVAGVAASSETWASGWEPSQESDALGVGRLGQS